MEQIDWLILGSTLLFIVLYGIWKNRSHQNVNEYIRGGNTAKWWTVGFSVMATQASAITFLSTPGQAFHDGMGFVQFYFGLPLAMIIICVFFLPVYHKLNVYTAYEFLEKRFDRKTRTLTALLFLIQRGLAAGVTIYAPAIILSVILGWNLKLLTVVIGLLVIGYTMIGGTRAVNVTQKQQMFVIFMGLVAAFFYTIYAFPADISFSEGLKIAGINKKLTVLDFSLDPNNRYTFWSGLTGGLFLALSYFGTDQSQVQRYLSGKSLKASQMGLIMNGLLKVPLQFFILLTGVMVFVFYQFEKAPLHFNPQVVQQTIQSDYGPEFNALQQSNDRLTAVKKQLLLQPSFFTDQGLQREFVKLEQQNKAQRSTAKSLIQKANPQAETNDKDYVFISFILDHLPQGLIGLLLAMIFSAAMSSTASELNALSATSLVDLYQVHRPGKSEKHYVGVAQLFTFLWGIIAILFASVGNLFENLIQLVNIIGSLFYGTILGVFLVAFFLKQVRGNAIFLAALVSEVAITILYRLDLVGFLWLNLIGAVLTVLLALGLQKTLFHENTSRTA
ncbi:MAG: sodium:solute symporter [Flavobacteriia bacterium]|nr:sodium:solute symporter [Flavobacteriia bacterium]